MRGLLGAELILELLVLLQLRLPLLFGVTAAGESQPENHQHRERQLSSPDHWEPPLRSLERRGPAPRVRKVAARVGTPQVSDSFAIDIHTAWPYKTCNIIASPQCEAGL